MLVDCFMKDPSVSGSLQYTDPLLSRPRRRAYSVSMRETIGWTRARILNGGSISLAELVSSSDFLEASDPRDKIYALI
jgi:hypothetical protein